MAKAKIAGKLAAGDRVDLTEIQPYSYPIRTVRAVVKGPGQGQVTVHWVEPVGHPNTMPADREITLR